MEKIEYLKKYNAAIQIVHLENLSEKEISVLPKYWVDSLSESFTPIKLKVVLDQWKKFPYQFQSTTNYLESSLLDIDLILENGQFGLLYTVRNLKGNNAYYVGYNPNTKKAPEYFATLPQSFREIYDNLHNGWVYYASKSNGLLPIEDTLILNDEEWGILEEIDIKDLPFDLNQCVGLFDNGKGDYASIDLRSDDKKKGFIWWHTKPPKLNVEIWPVIDEWTKIGMER